MYEYLQGKLPGKGLSEVEHNRGLGFLCAYQLKITKQIMDFPIHCVLVVGQVWLSGLGALKKHTHTRAVKQKRMIKQMEPNGMKAGSRVVWRWWWIFHLNAPRIAHVT